MMTYKALNTFIDDIFAFVIKMPTMYRIGCFRDDIVFFIFLYQKYTYRVSINIRKTYSTNIRKNFCPEKTKIERLNMSNISRLIIQESMNLVFLETCWKKPRRRKWKVPRMEKLLSLLMVETKMH